jgi:ectoine hydroxylase-related dioxygenase (phytanoyl-CoA dioxygenase family)
MKDIFKSQEHQSHFDKYGYVVIDANLAGEIDKMEAFIGPYLANLSTDFYYSLIANDLEENKRIRGKIRNGLQLFYDTFLLDYKSLNESFLVKPANTSDELLLHQDWCYTHEERFQSLTLWMPLCDVNENNGALFFLPGSHKWFNNLRSSSFATARISSSDLPTGELQQVNLRKGQLLLFHPAIFHGSFPNNSSHPRTVVTSVILSEDADYIYFQAVVNDQEKNVKTFKLDEDSFLRELKTMAVGADPSTELIDRFHYNHPVISPADLHHKALA